MSRPHYDAVLEWSNSGVVGGWSPTRKIGPHPTLGEFAGQAVLVAVSRRACFVRTTEIPRAPRDAQRSILQHRLGSLFPLEPAATAFDFWTVDHADGTSTAVVAAMPTAELNRLNLVLKEAGIRVVQIVPSGIGVLGLGEGAPSVMVHRTPEGLAIDAVRGQEILASRFASTTDGPGEVARTLKIAGLESARVFGGSDIPFADEATSRVPLEEAFRRAPGLDLNLVPTEVLVARDRAKIDRLNRSAVLMAVATVALGAYVYLDRQDAQKIVDRRKTQMNTTLRKLERTKADTEAKVATAEKERQMLAVAFEPAQRLSDVYAIVSREAPRTMWLTGFNAERGKPATIRGTAMSNPDVTQLLDALTGSDRLRDVKLVFANNAQIEERSVVQFSLSVFPVGNLPLVIKETRRGARRSTR